MTTCRLSTGEYAQNAELAASHGKCPSVREDAIVPALDELLARLLDPENLDDTAAAISAASPIDDVLSARAEADLSGITLPREVTVDDVRDLVEALGDVRARLASAPPSLKAAIYADLAVTVAWEPGSDTTTVRVAPHLYMVRVGGGT